MNHHNAKCPRGCLSMPPGIPRDSSWRFDFFSQRKTRLVALEESITSAILRSGDATPAEGGVTSKSHSPTQRMHDVPIRRKHSRHHFKTTATRAVSQYVVSGVPDERAHPCKGAALCDHCQTCKLHHSAAMGRVPASPATRSFHLGAEGSTLARSTMRAALPKRSQRRCSARLRSLS